MHYKNGREAKAGDKVLQLGESIYEGDVGILHSLMPGSETCNGYIRTTKGEDKIVSIKECLAFDDIRQADIPDSTAA